LEFGIDRIVYVDAAKKKGNAGVATEKSKEIEIWRM
jgi:hypothetical protein